MNATRTNTAGPMAVFVSFILTLSAASFAAYSYYQPNMMLVAIGLFVFSAAFKAYQRGMLAELLSYGRLIGAFMLGWFFKAPVGTLIGVNGIFASIAGFYLLFFCSYLLAGWFIKTILKNHEPSMPSRFLGAIAGGFEGLVISLFVFIAMTLIPGSQLASHQPEFLKMITGSTEKIISPLIPEEAGKAVRAIKTMSRLSQGIDPEKVDRGEIIEVMKPLSSLPEIQKIQTDEQLQKLVREKDFKKLFKHPTIRKLMQNPELQNKVMNLDWARLERALNKARTANPD
ncbi:MAG: Colicin production protein [Clostridiales bacterium]|nr:Colicin production protein [Clostridiales bacterium]MDN5280892.1 Colicin production protein [Candidatus Ozemobacter sp.]